MNKNDFAKKFTDKVDGLTKKDALVIIDTLSEIITEALVVNDEVTIPGVGKFGVKEVAERTGKLTLGDKIGETYTVPAHKAPKFKAAKALKDTLANK